MAQTIKKGYPQVPRLKDNALMRFLYSVRSALLELQRLSAFFSGLTDAQQTQLLAALQRLSAAESKVSDQVQTIGGMQQAIIDQQVLIDAQAVINASQAGSLSTLSSELTAQQGVTDGLATSVGGLLTAVDDLDARVDALEGA